MRYLSISCALVPVFLVPFADIIAAKSAGAFDEDTIAGCISDVVEFAEKLLSASSYKPLSEGSLPLEVLICAQAVSLYTMWLRQLLADVAVAISYAAVVEGLTTEETGFFPRLAWRP